MALPQLTDEQIRTWTLEQKDRWWLENVYKGDMPQLTLRSAAFGMLIGGFLSLTNLYVGMKTGWTLGVGITSVILAYSFFKTMHSLKLINTEFTVLENNCMQSIATAAGYMTSPLIASLAAYMMITGKVIPWYVAMIWMMALAVLGVLFAFPLKKRYINDDQMPFPEGRAAGVVMDSLHTGDSASGVFKAKLLIFFGLGSALIKVLVDHDFMNRIKLAFMAIPEALEKPIFHLFNADPKVRGVPLQQLTVSLEPDHVMAATGGLMGIRVGFSLLLGAVLNYVIIVPYIIENYPGHIVPKLNGNYGFREITTWALWGGVALMTTASLTAFLSKPAMLFSAFSGLFSKKEKKTDLLEDIELPMRVFVIGIPIIGAIVVVLAKVFFGVDYLMAALAIPLVFVFTIIAANATGLTSITPLGALGKITQLTFGVLKPGDMKTNIITASITAEVSGHASNLLMDIKPGYMLGAKPRQQAIGHVLGIIAGGLASVPIFYLLFLKGNPAGLVSEQYPMPSAIVWKAVAEVLNKGVHSLPQTAQIAALIGAILGIALEITNIIMKGRSPLSAVGIGLAFVIPFTTAFAMFFGSLLFWLAGAMFKREGSFAKLVLVDNLEPVCAGIIAGGSLTGIMLAVVQVLAA